MGACGSLGEPPEVGLERRWTGLSGGGKEVRKTPENECPVPGPACRERAQGRRGCGLPSLGAQPGDGTDGAG